MDEVSLPHVFMDSTVAWSTLVSENYSFGDALLKYHSAGAIGGDYLPLLTIILSLIRVHHIVAVYFIAYGI